ncbi:MAG: hypothetical protein O2779_02535 [Nanoarchaeota archaeon]|nr:hypothetical protein [Nanoarchaeota archaeon]
MNRNMRLIVLILVAALLVTTVQAASVSEAFTGALDTLENFFSGGWQQHEKSLAFMIVFVLFFSAFMIGAKKAFGEINRPVVAFSVTAALLSATILVITSNFTLVRFGIIASGLLFLMVMAVVHTLLMKMGMEKTGWSLLLAFLITALLFGLGAVVSGEGGVLSGLGGPFRWLDGLGDGVSSGSSGGSSGSSGTSASTGTSPQRIQEARDRAQEIIKGEQTGSQEDGFFSNFLGYFSDNPGKTGIGGLLLALAVLLLVYLRKRKPGEKGSDAKEDPEPERKHNWGALTLEEMISFFEKKLKEKQDALKSLMQVISKRSELIEKIKNHGLFLRSFGKLVEQGQEGWFAISTKGTKAHNCLSELKKLLPKLESTEKEISNTSSEVRSFEGELVEVAPRIRAFESGLLYQGMKMQHNTDQLHEIQSKILSKDRRAELGRLLHHVTEQPRHIIDLVASRFGGYDQDTMGDEEKKEVEKEEKNLSPQQKEIHPKNRKQPPIYGMAMQFQHLIRSANMFVEYRWHENEVNDWFGKLISSLEAIVRFVNSEIEPFIRVISPEHRKLIAVNEAYNGVGLPVLLRITKELHDEIKEVKKILELLYWLRGDGERNAESYRLAFKILNHNSNRKVNDGETTFEYRLDHVPERDVIVIKAMIKQGASLVKELSRKVKISCVVEHKDGSSFLSIRNGHVVEDINPQESFVNDEGFCLFHYQLWPGVDSRKIRLSALSLDSSIIIEDSIQKEES